MLGSMTSGDLAMVVAMRQGISFTDYEPRGLPGFESTIAAAVGCSENQIDNLLRAVDVIEDDHHFTVIRREVRPRGQGSKGEVIPAMIRVTITPA